MQVPKSTSTGIIEDLESHVESDFSLWYNENGAAYLCIIPTNPIWPGVLGGSFMGATVLP